jgi:hypothetical protein
MMAFRIALSITWLLVPPDYTDWPTGGTSEFLGLGLQASITAKPFGHRILIE